MELEILVNLGLSNAEARIYLVLLETGSTLAGPVIKKTGLHRGTAYQILQRLKEKGLVSSVIKGKKQYFQAADPQRLLDVLKEKEDSFKSILPGLKAKINESKEKQEVTVYYGVKGIRTVFDKMLEELNPNGTYYDFGVPGSFRDIMGGYWDLWQKQKRRHKIKSFVIFNETVKQINPNLLKDYFGKARFHSKDFPSTTDTMIYNETVILFIWTAKPPVAVVIKNRENAQSYKNQFKMMWKNAMR